MPSVRAIEADMSNISGTTKQSIGFKDDDLTTGVTSLKNTTTSLSSGGTNSTTTTANGWIVVSAVMTSGPSASNGSLQLIWRGSGLTTDVVLWSQDYTYSATNPYIQLNRGLAVRSGDIIKLLWNSSTSATFNIQIIQVAVDGFANTFE